MCALSPHPPDGFLSMHELRQVLSGRGMSGTWSVPVPFGSRWADLFRWLPWPRRDRDRDRDARRFPEWGILALLLAALLIGSADTGAVRGAPWSGAADGTVVDPATGATAPPNGEYDRGSGRREEVRRGIVARGAPPDVVGLSPEEARAALEQAGWTVAGVELGPEGGRPGTVVGAQPQPSGGGEQGSRSVTLAVDPLNVALNRPARLATGEPGPAALVDGDPETVGQAEGPGVSSVEIELARPGTVVAVELLGGRDAAAAPSHVPSLLLADQRQVDFEAFAGPTADRQAVRIRLNEPMADVTAVRIATSDSTGELALREIRILGW
jgi:hypothetical protein